VENDALKFIPQKGKAKADFKMEMESEA